MLSQGERERERERERNKYDTTRLEERKKKLKIEKNNIKQWKLKDEKFILWKMKVL